MPSNSELKPSPNDSSIDTFKENKKRLYKCIILLSVCFLHITRQYCLNLTVGLQQNIIQVMKIDNTMYGIVHSVVFYPGMILPLIGGVIIDKFFEGKLYPLPFLAALGFLGQIVVTIGPLINSVWGLIIGRFIVGFADGFQINMLFTSKTRWFKKDLTFAMAVGLTFSRVGGTLALWLPQLMYDNLVGVFNPSVRLGLVISVGTIFMFISFLASVVVVALDVDGHRTGLIETYNKETKIKLNECKNLTLHFWLVFISINAFYSAILTSVANGQALFINKYGLSIIEASIANSVVFLGTVIINPFLGLLINISQYHMLWGIAGTMLGIGSNLLILCTSLIKLIPYILSSMNAASFSFYAVAMWSVIPRFVQQHQLNTAYGLLNWTLPRSAATILTGIIVDKVGYTFQAVFYIAIHMIGFISLGIVLIKVDDIRTINNPTDKTSELQK